jgi:hypothetical protein
MQWTVMRLPLLSAAQLTPLYSKAADIAMLYQKGKIATLMQLICLESCRVVHRH